MIAFAILACGLVDAPGVDLAFPIRVRVVATFDGRSPETEWSAFLDKLFDHFDRDGDGALSRIEVDRVFPLPLPNGREAKPDFAKLDGKLSRAEFRESYRRAGFAPVVAIVRSPSAEQLRLSAALLHHLDRDGDGTLSAAEWKQAPALLRRLDENENEYLEPAELLANVPPFRLPSATTSVKVMTDAGKPDATLRVELGAKPSAKFDGAFDMPGGKLRYDLPPASHTAFASASEFYLAQYAEAAGKKPSLTRKEVVADAGLSAVAGMFTAADRDDNGKLTAAELRSLLELVELGLSCQVVVKVDDRGRNLFDHLDANADGRLDVAELTRIAGTTIANSYRLSVVRGVPCKTFGPVPVPTIAPPKPTASLREAVGPDWFRAMDSNGDGYVSAAEFRGPPELFAKLDTDKDGRVSAIEADAAVR